MQAEGASVFFHGAAQWLVSPAGRRDTWGPLQSLSGDRLVTLLGPYRGGRRAQLAKRPGGAPRAAAAGGKGEATKVRAGGSVGGLQAVACGLVPEQAGC